MKRSNRLVLLVGVFLAVIAFVGVLLLSQSKEPPPPEEATRDVVIADVICWPLRTSCRAIWPTTWDGIL